MMKKLHFTRVGDLTSPCLVLLMAAGTLTGLALFILIQYISLELPYSTVWLNILGMPLLCLLFAFGLILLSLFFLPKTPPATEVIKSSAAPSEKCPNLTELPTSLEENHRNG